MPRTPENRSFSHMLMNKEHETRIDRPVGGALHPANGTITLPIIVVGATGTIGRNVIRSFVERGRPVVAVAPDRDRLEGLRQEHPEGALTTLAERVLDDSGAARLAQQLRALDRPPTGAVIAFPAGKAPRTCANRGRLLDQSSDELRECLAQTLLPQLALARELIPLIAESGRVGSYVIVGGPGSEAPWAGYGHRSIAMAATRMLAQVLYDEAQPLGVRVHLLSIDSPVRGEVASAHDCPEWPTVSGIAGRVVQLVDRAEAAGPADAVVTCGRSAARSFTRAQTFHDVPAFLASLRARAQP